MSNDVKKAVNFIAVLMFWFSSFGLSAEKFEASNSNSQLTFSGQHAGMDFSGEFEQWQSVLVLPPAKSPSISATFILSSAKTGDWTYDSTLPEEDWFNTKRHPEGRFVSNSISVISNGYAVSGELSLRGITKPVEFDLIGNTQTGFKANIVIDRLAFDIGLESDPSAEWVSREITIALTIGG